MDIQLVGLVVGLVVYAIAPILVLLLLYWTVRLAVRHEMARQRPQ